MRDSGIGRPRDREDFPARKRRTRAFTSGRCIHNTRVHAPSTMRRCVTVLHVRARVYAYTRLRRVELRLFSYRRLSPGSFVSFCSFFFLSLRLVTPRSPTSTLARSFSLSLSLSPALLFFAESRGRKNVGDFRARNSAVFHSWRRRCEDVKTPRHYATNVRRTSNTFRDFYARPNQFTGKYVTDESFRELFVVFRWFRVYQSQEIFLDLFAVIFIQKKKRRNTLRSFLYYCNLVKLNNF